MLFVVWRHNRMQNSEATNFYALLIYCLLEFFFFLPQDPLSCNVLQMVAWMLIEATFLLSRFTLFYFSPINARIETVFYSLLKLVFGTQHMECNIENDAAQFF